MRVLSDAGFCPAVFDEYLCWPRTRAGESAEQKCPKGVAGLDENSECTYVEGKITLEGGI